MGRRAVAIAALGAAVFGAPRPAHAWGDDGHRITAHVAERFLDPAVRRRVDALLAADQDDLTGPDLASRAAWADRYRDSDRSTSRARYEATYRWHFVDLELARPDLDEACFGRPKLPPGTPASRGPARSCIVDKIDQFAAELADAAVPEAERLLAFKFLIHLIGDVHQPLHAADDMDRGGNAIKLRHGPHGTADNLHAYWDVALVRRLGTDPREVADRLVQDFRGQEARWMAGTAEDWAWESFRKAREVAYRLPQEPGADRKGAMRRIDQDYERRALDTVREQLVKAGMRMAMVLNRALAP